MPRPLFIGLCLAIAASPAAADDQLVKGCALPTYVVPVDAAGVESLDLDTIDILTGRAEISTGGDAVFSEALTLSQGERRLRAESAEYSAAERVFEVRGDVQYADPETLINGGSARFDALASTVEFRDADFVVTSVPARGAAERVFIEGTARLTLEGVSYSTCAPGEDDWLLEASDISIDQESGIGTARNARLKFFGVPILWLPYVSYPVTDQRKSGWLLPNIGRSNRRGFDLEFPWYWNIAPNYDATLIPRYMSRRGLQLGAEFRYLYTQHEGTLGGEFLPSDDITGDDRTLVSWYHRSHLSRGWRATIDARDVSDSAYFEDLSGSLSGTSQTHLSRTMDFERNGEYLDLLLRFEGYQTIDDTIADADKPYRRLPQLRADGHWPDLFAGLALRVLGDASYFDRDTGVTGGRLHLAPELSWPADFGGVRITPAVALTHTRYSLDDTAPGADDSLERTAPVYSLDAGAVFERSYARDGEWLQTLEPRILFVRIPFRAQDELPVFDTIMPDLNLVQLYRRNRFLGYDRLGDTRQVSLGLTTRLIHATDGSQFLAATIGQIRYLTGQDVTLPGELPSNDNSSDYLAELSMNLYDNWNMDLGYQWNSDTRRTAQAEARLQYRPDEDRVINLSYRFRRDSLEEVDVSAAWPIGDRWKVVGRYDYSLRDDEPLERFIGVEYQTCCFGIRAVWRRHLARRTGESDTAVALQLILKGFTSLGNPTDKLLERGILGYTRD